MLASAFINADGLSIEDELEMMASNRKYLRLASWNIRILSNKRTDEELEKIATVAKKFDLVAIMELRDEKVLQRLVDTMNKISRKTYSYVVSSYVGNTSFAAAENNFGTMSDEFSIEAHRELYGFVYDSSFIRCTDKPKIYNDSFFFRKPVHASFKARNFDFTIIANHIIWGKTVTQRRKEIQRLARVYENIQKRSSENDIILLGDFNRNPDDDLAWGPLRAISGMEQLFQLPKKSMILDTNLYDNILFQGMYTREYTLDKGIENFDEYLFNNDDKKASKAVSDHRPVWARFRITSRDDD